MSCMVIPPEVLFSLRIVFAILDFLFFQKYLQIALSISVKSWVVILFFFIFLIRYFLHLHFKCYPKHPPYPTPCFIFTSKKLTVFWSLEFLLDLFHHLQWGIHGSLSLFLDFLIGYFIYLHFKCPSSRVPLHKLPPHPLPPASMRVRESHFLRCSIYCFQSSELLEVKFSLDYV